MANKDANEGKFFGYYVEVNLPDVKGKPSFTTFHPRGYGFHIAGDINFGDSGSAGSNEIQIYNVAPEHQEYFKKSGSIVIKAGPKDLFGVISQGKITKVGREIPDGMDKSITLTFTEGPTFDNSKMYSKYNGSKKVKKSYKTSDGRTITYEKVQKKKVNIPFRKGVKASQIIARICREAQITLEHCKLKEDHVYKKGYTLSAKPETALKSIAKDCKSKFYYRRGGYVIDSQTEPNPYNEHIFISPTTGLINNVEYGDDDDDNTLTFTSMIDPRISTGSVVELEDPDTKTKGLYRVKSGSYSLDNMTMSVVCAL